MFAPRGCNGPGGTSPKLRRLLRRHSRGQHVLSVSELRLEDFLHRRDRFALGENHFGKAATATTIEVQLRFAQRGGRRLASPADELFEGNVAVEELLGEFFDVMALHESMIANRR